MFFETPAETTMKIQRSWLNHWVGIYSCKQFRRWQVFRGCWRNQGWLPKTGSNTISYDDEKMVSVQTPERHRKRTQNLQWSKGGEKELGKDRATIGTIRRTLGQLGSPW